jgi:voltage-gated sodium channel
MITPNSNRRTWLVFDLFVVVFSWIFMGTSASVLRAFRIFRVFSLASKWSSMQQLFSAVGKTMPKMGVVAGLLLLLFYSFTVLCTYLFCGLYDEGYLDYDYFGRLDWTFITLFQMLTTDTWFVIVRQVMDASPYSYLLFFFWVSLTSIIILNLIIAIICESLILLKDDLTESEEAGASAAFKQQVPIDYLLKQQRDIDRAQGEMEVAINSLMLRITASKASAVSSRNAMKGSVRASFAL